MDLTDCILLEQVTSGTTFCFDIFTGLLLPKVLNGGYLLVMVYNEMWYTWTVCFHIWRQPRWSFYFLPYLDDVFCIISPEPNMISQKSGCLPRWFEGQWLEWYHMQHHKWFRLDQNSFSVQTQSRLLAAGAVGVKGLLKGTSVVVMREGNALREQVFDCRCPLIRGNLHVTGVLLRWKKKWG